MIILFDLISTQGFINGGAEYTIKIFNTLVNSIQSKDTIFGLFDSRKKIVYEEMAPQYLKDHYNIDCIDLSKNQLSRIIKEHSIDKFFIGIGQRFEEFNLQNIDCQVICVIHDLFQKEIEDNNIHLYLKLHSWKSIFRHYLGEIKNKLLSNDQKQVYSNLSRFIHEPNVEIVTVSEYSKYSLLYYFKNLNKEISVLYSPEKENHITESFENNELAKIISEEKKYFVLLSADRRLKNAEKVLSVFKEFSITHPDHFLVTVGGVNSDHMNHINLPYLNVSDLEQLLKNSYALVFSSFFEGFGYPPLEAMKYNKPVLSSNVCSMPEILGNAPVYFSPFYNSDIFKALNKTVDNYEFLVKKSIEQYDIIKSLQDQSLNSLIKKILLKN